jgi:urate oxidase
VVRLGANRYGKAETRVVRVVRSADGPAGDVLRDRNVSTSLSGDLAAVHLEGDNANVVATDTQKNVVNAFTQRFGDLEPEAFAIALATHFVAGSISRARVSVEEFGWARLGPHSFQRRGDTTRTARVVHDATAGTSVVAGVADLIVMNTTNSEFWGFERDEYTTLAETHDRILATAVSTSWRYRSVDVDWAAAYETALAGLLAAFVDTYSYSLQQTLYAMGSRVIADVPEICEVRLTLPNKHHFLIDLSPFGQQNDNEVYYAADRPYGLIEGTVLADDAPDPGPAWD